MANIIGITDLNDPGIRAYTHMTEAQLRNRLEPEEGIFIAESPKVIRLALDAGCVPVSMLTDRRHIEGQAAELIRRCGDIPVYTAESGLLEQLTGFRLTRGVFCAMKRPAPADAETVCKDATRVAVLENIADSTNVGALFRCAAALGIDAVLITPTCCDPLCRRAVRVSMGTVFRIPWARIGQTPGDWPEKGLKQLSTLGFKTVAMALSDRSLRIDDPRLAREAKLAVILGTEGDGLAEQTIANCNYTVRIPMSHQVDSLNVAAAGAVAFRELRDRTKD